MKKDEILSLENETEEYRRFDLEGQIDEWKKERDELTKRGGDGLHRSISEYQLRESVKSRWLSLEQECDAHNINEAFRLASEAETERDKKPFIRFYTNVLKGITYKYFKHGYSKPIKWETKWDV